MDQTETLVPPSEITTITPTPEAESTAPSASDAVQVAENILEQARQDVAVPETITPGVTTPPIEQGSNMYGLNNVDAAKVGQARSNATPAPSSDFSFTNNVSREQNLDNVTTGRQVDGAINMDLADPNPGFENPIAVGSSTEKEIVEKTGIMNLAEIKTLAESKRKIAFLENRLKDTLTNDTAAVSLIAEANQDLAKAVDDVQKEPDPNKKRGLFKLVGAGLGALALISALLPGDGGRIDTGNSGMTDAEIVALNNQMRNTIGEAGKKLDVAFSGVANPDSLKDISNALTDNENTDKLTPPSSGSIFPEKPPLVGPEVPPINQTGLTGGATEPIAPATGDSRPADADDSHSPFFDNRPSS